VWPRLYEDLRADLRYAVRILLRNPGFTVIAVGSLALGIGANTAIFSFTKMMLFDNLAVQHPEELRLLSWVAPERSVVKHIWGDTSPTSGGQRTGTSFPYEIFFQLQRENHVLSDMFAFKDLGRQALTIDGEAISAQAELISGNYYRALAVQPVLGRAILPSDDSIPASGAVAVISNQLWTTRFGRSPAVIGKEVELNAKPVIIVGVNPPEFTGAGDTKLSPDIFLPLSMQPQIVSMRNGSILNDSGFWWLQIMGRSRPKISIADAQLSLDAIFSSFVRSNAPQASDFAIPHLRLLDARRGLDVRSNTLTTPLYLLSALAGLVLLLACANIANLLLARSAARQREIGVRIALGANRARILRQMFTESILLSVGGGLCGVAIAYACRNVLPSLMASPWKRTEPAAQFDTHVLLFTALISILTGILFGLTPARKALQIEVNSELRDNSHTVTHVTRGLAGKGVVIFQVFLSTLLVASAALFVRTFLNLRSVNPGFETTHLLLFKIQLPAQQYPPPKDIALFRTIEEHLSAVPGVESATLSQDALISNRVSMDDFIPIDQAESLGKSENTGVWSNAVGQTFFSTMAIPILAGRSFSSEDTQNGQKVAVINKRLAQRFFPDTNPIGKLFRGYYNVDQVPFRIIGVCPDIHFGSLRQQPPPTYYVLYDQLPASSGEMTYEIRTRMRADTLVRSIRRMVQSIDNNVPLIDVRTQADQIDETIQREKILADLTAGFGTVALLLACIGLFGLMAYSVARRTNEFGIRLAMGARAPQIVGMILKETIQITLCGVSLGLLVAILVTRFLRAMLFGLKPNDPVTLASTATGMLFVALLAGLIPALRGSRVEPMRALRHN
jgi:predicted permease